MNAQEQLQKIIYDWVADNFGTSEADNPSWSIEALASHLAKNLKAEHLFGKAN